jgi:hypothetical protein
MESGKVHFTQYMNSSFEEEIQNLFFFHPDQKTYKKRILQSIIKFGKPELIHHESGLTFRLVGNLDSHQTLFVHSKQGDSILLGIVIWVKTENTMNLAHLLLNKSFTPSENEYNFREIMLGLIKMSSFFKGIDSIGLVYTNKKIPLIKLGTYLTDLSHFN